MKTAEELFIEVTTGEFSTDESVKNHLRAIQIDALQHALNLVQYSDPVATVNAIGAEIQKLKEKESGR